MGQQPPWATTLSSPSVAECPPPGALGWSSPCPQRSCPRPMGAAPKGRVSSSGRLPEQAQSPEESLHGDLGAVQPLVPDTGWAPMRVQASTPPGEGALVSLQART